MARRRKYQPGIDMSGPFFRVDPVKTFRRNIEDFMDAVAEAGERDVKARWAGIGTGRTRNRFVGRTRALTGKEWQVTAVVSPVVRDLSRKEAISVMAAASLIESRSQPVKRMTAAMRRYRKGINDLFKGLT